MKTIALEKAMATHSSTLAWKIPWMEEPGRRLSIRLHRVGHDSAAQKTIAQETAPQIPPRNCFKEVGERYIYPGFW